MSSSVLWGVLGYSGAVLIAVLVLTFWLIKVIKEKYKAQSGWDHAKMELETAQSVVKALKAQELKLRKGIKELRDELEKSDGTGNPDGVADRLGELLSEKLEDKDSESGDTVSASSKSKTPSG